MAAPYWDVKVESTSHANVALRHPHTNPLKIRKGLRPGRITGIDVWFPPGCGGLVGVQVYIRETILAPTDSGEWIHGDRTMWHWELDWPVYGAGNYIGIKVYNDDDTYWHTPGIAVSLLPFAAIPVTDMLLSQILMVLQEIKSALLVVPRAAESAIDKLAALLFRR